MKLHDNYQFKVDRKDELKRHEDIGEMDLWLEKQSTLLPKIETMQDLTIEMNFKYLGLDGSKFLEWYQGKIIKLTNETKVGV